MDITMVYETISIGSNPIIPASDFLPEQLNGLEYTPTKRLVASSSLALGANLIGRQ